MDDNKVFHCVKLFYKIPEVCELLDLDMDKLRYQCLLHNIFPSTCQCALGFDISRFQKLKAVLFSERYRTALLMRECNETINDNPWA